MSSRATVWKTSRILGVSLALLALVLFSIVVVSDFDCHNSADDARCPYCHLTHQTPANLEVAPSTTLLEPVHSLPLPEDIVAVTLPVFSQTAPRAPPF